MAILTLGLLVIPSLQASIEVLLNCRVIRSDAERLECFDIRAADLCETESCTNKTSANDSQGEETKVVSTSKEKTPDGTLFGLSKNPKEKKIERIESIIKNIRLAAYGKHVFTLENGQVWMENEPGRKKVKNKQQKVVIERKRLRYLISFESGISLAVHRIE